MPEDVVKNKVIPLSLKGKALTWHRLLDDIGSWNYNRLKLEFHQKFYPMHLVHRDRNYIYTSTRVRAQHVQSSIRENKSPTLIFFFKKEVLEKSNKSTIMFCLYVKLS